MPCWWPCCENLRCDPCTFFDDFSSVQSGWITVFDNPTAALKPEFRMEDGVQKFVANPSAPGGFQGGAYYRSFATAHLDRYIICLDARVFAPPESTYAGIFVTPGTNMFFYWRNPEPPFESGGGEITYLDTVIFQSPGLVLHQYFQIPTQPYFAAKIIIRSDTARWTPSDHRYIVEFWLNGLLLRRADNQRIQGFGVSGFANAGVRGVDETPTSGPIVPLVWDDLCVYTNVGEASSE